MEEGKLNIGIFIDTFFPMVDGVVSVVDNYARLLSERANVTVFTIKTKKQFDDSKLPYKVVRCKSVKVLNLDYSLGMPQFDEKFKKEVKNADLDIVHIHSPFSIGKMGLKYAKKHKIPVVATLHSQFEKDFMLNSKSKILTKILLAKVVSVFNKCTELWTMNSACEKLSRDYGYKGKVSIVPNATDLVNNFTEQEIINAKTEIKNKYGIADDEKIFISVGRVNKLKNLDLSIDACKKLCDKDFKFKFLIVGDGNDKKYFLDKVKKLNIEDKVVFVGKVVDKTEKDKLFAAADLHLFPSYYDTDGIVKIEASAFNLPTLFALDSFAASSVEDSISGYVAEGTIDKYAEKIIDIFENKKVYDEVCVNCKKTLYKTWDNIVNEVYDKYIELVINNKANNIKKNNK